MLWVSDVLVYSVAICKASAFFLSFPVLKGKYIFSTPGAQMHYSNSRDKCLVWRSCVIAALLKIPEVNPRWCYSHLSPLESGCWSGAFIFIFSSLFNSHLSIKCLPRSYTSKRCPPLFCAQEEKCPTYVFFHAALWLDSHTLNMSLIWGQDNWMGWVRI